MKEEDLPELGGHEAYVCSSRRNENHGADILLHTGEIKRGYFCHTRQFVKYCVEIGGDIYLGVGVSHE